MDLVQDITTLNKVCGVATGCLLLSWILDILCQNVSDNGGVYHNAWREVCRCCSSDNSEDVEDAEVDADQPDQDTRL